ncbi:MAG TPA: sigma-54 dependent transcriptional regulator, partial [Candidatus Bathyarchaeia archaeon]|nr:sigma-54 dependent transcriptional regulator [Candidatus Bathyarchaeia archaeon]
MDPLIELLGESPAIESARETIRRLLARQHGVRRPPAVLLEGETGTGKGLVAKLIHQVGPRAANAFVHVNCAAIPENLLESELFGHERGAFTDARRARPGLFQTAHQGTLFLDEVALLPEALQAKLLTAIEERAVRRLGSTHPEPADAWIISATNSDLPAAIRARQFREDLYHRLAVVTLRLPPLRERGRDVVLLARHLLGRVCADYGLPAKTLSPEAEDLLVAHPWQGNVRELNNVLERVALLTDRPVVTADLLELPPPARSGATPPAGAEPARTVASVDEALRDHLQRTLEQTGWNISRTAEQLGITRNTVRAWIGKRGLAPEPGAARPRRPSTPRAARAEARPASPAVPVPAAPPQGPNAIRWESRRVTLLRAALVGTEGAPPDKGRALDVLLDKLQSFGARIDELSPTSVGAIFGLEPVEDAQRRA